MDILVPKLKEADIIIWASPVYYSGVTGPLKNVMDRQLPIHVLGSMDEKKQKVVLVSTCGDWDISMFDPLLMQMKVIYGRPDGSSSFAGALLCPMADGVKEMIKAGETGLVDGVFLAAREAGRQLAREGVISEELQQKVSRPLMPREAYYKAAQMMMDEMKKARK
jgi:multimeric flavodoxin WrbA